MSGCLGRHGAVVGWTTFLFVADLWPQLSGNMPCAFLECFEQCKLRTTMPAVCYHIYDLTAASLLHIFSTSLLM